MSLCCYLAMTAAEFYAQQDLPSGIAWMACHFSVYGTGLTNLPPQLPENSLVILNDRIPALNHDPVRIRAQLEELAQRQHISGILLDLQQPNDPTLAAVVKELTRSPPCPIGVTQSYAKDTSCAVFLPPPALNKPLKSHLIPWEGREIWLEAATESTKIDVTSKGSFFTELSESATKETAFTDSRLHCRYSMDIRADCVTFSLHRDKQQLQLLLEEAEALGVNQAIGLYQQLHPWK